MSTTKIALRNLSRQKRRTILLGGAIAFGVMVTTLVNGFSGGLIVNIEANVSKMVAGHIVLSSAHRDENKKTILSMEMTPGIEAAVRALPYPVAFTQKRTQTNATLVFETNSMGRTVEGVDWANDHFLMDDLKLTVGKKEDLTDPKAILLSQKQADKLGVRVGEDLFVQVQTVHGQANYDAFTVKAIYDDTNSTLGSSAYVGLEAADRLLDMSPGSFNLYGITLKRFSDTDQAVAAFVQLLPKELKVPARSPVGEKSFNEKYTNYKKDKKNFEPLTIVSSVNDELAPIKGQIMAVNFLALLILVVLLLVVMVGLANTYRIIVFERSREIGTMRAMGMQRGAVERIFLWEAVFLSLAGALGGILLASVLLTGISLITWGADVASSGLAFVLINGHLTWRLDGATLVITTLLVAGMTWLAALFPARKAGRVDPAVALRTTA